MIWATRLWDSAFHRIPTVSLLVFVISNIVLAQSTTITTATSKTITGTTIVTNAPSPLTDCDGVGTFFCATGTCYTGHDGFIGCCTVSSCAARTTCIPYTENVVQTCNVDVGGCIACSSVAPSCITIKNIAMGQYIMYCDTFSTVATLSYTNLVTYGSMALLPASNNRGATSASSESALSAPSMLSGAIIAATGASIASVSVDATPPNTTLDFSGLSHGAVAGITVSCVAVVAAAIIFFMAALRKKRNKGQRGIYEKSKSFNENQNITDGMIPMKIGEQGDAASPRRLQKVPGPRDGGPMLSRTDADNPPKYLSPIVRHRPARLAEARDAERAYELDGATTPSTGAVFYSPELSSEINQDTRSSRCAPLQTSQIDEGDAGAQRFASNAPFGYKPYRPDTDAENRPAELFTIRQIHPSSSQNPSPTSTYPVSPDPNPHLTSPLIGGVSPQTPLMTKWLASDRASVGQVTPIRDPAATIHAPINWPSSDYQLSRRGEVVDGSPGGRIERSLTSATGAGGCRYVSPEMAMVEGFDAGSEGVE